jgi:hypothetical protein
VLDDTDHSPSSARLEGPAPVEVPDDKNVGITAPTVAAHDEHASPIPLAHEQAPSEVVPTALPSADILPEDNLYSESRDTPQSQLERHEEEPENDEEENVAPHSPESVAKPHQDGEDAEEEEEGEEAARRRRVAERLAKMGAFNPFAPPPRRQSSGFSDAPAVGAAERLADIPASPVRHEDEDEAVPADDAESPIDEGQEDAPLEAGQVTVEAELEDLEEEQDGKY